MRISHIIVAALLAAFIQPLSAAESPFDYNYIDLRAGYADLDGEDGVAALIGISRSLNNQLFAQAAYQYGTAFDVDYWRDDAFAAVGIRKATDEKTDILATAGLLAEWVEYCGYYCYDDSDVGLRLTAGVRHQLQPNIELNAEVELVSIFDETNTGIIVGVQTTPAPGQVSLGAQLKAVEDLTIYSVIVRF